MESFDADHPRSEVSLLRMRDRLEMGYLSPIELADMERRLPMQKYGIVQTLKGPRYRAAEDEMIFVASYVMVSLLRPLAYTWVIQHWTKELRQRVNNALNGHTSPRQDDFTTRLRRATHEMLFILGWTSL